MGSESGPAVHRSRGSTQVTEVEGYEQWRLHRNRLLGVTSMVVERGGPCGLAANES